VAALLTLRVLASPITPALIISPGLVVFTVEPGTFFTLNAPEGYFGTQDGKPSDPVIELGFQFAAGQPSSVSGSGSNLDVEKVSLHDFHFSTRVDVASTKLNECCTGSVVMQTAGATFEETGQQQSTPIEIVVFSLQSATPLQVTYGGAFPSFFDVFVTLDPNSIQQPGSLSMTATDSNSGIFSITLPVAYQMSFVNQNPGGPAASPMAFGGDFEGSGSFAAVPEPSTFSLLALALWGAWLLRRRRNPH
jgi:hypothetical protein